MAVDILTTHTCSNCGGASSNVSLFADGYVLCGRCKAKMQERYDRETGWHARPATEADEKLRAWAER